MLAANATLSVIESEPDAQLASASLPADSYLPGAYDCQADCDIDPDEPPSGNDIHDSVHEEIRLRLPRMAGGAVEPSSVYIASRSSYPLLKPPRAA